MREVVVVGGVRTPVGNFGGALKDLSAQELGRMVLVEALSRTGVDPSVIDEVIVGCASQGSDAPNIARVIALNAGIPKEVPAYTVHRNCASGVQAIMNAAQAIALGDADVVMVAGCESMSSAPYVNRDMRFGKRLRHSQFIDTLWEGLTDPVCGQMMGLTAENLVEEFGITREDQDKFAADSHKKAFRATREGRFKDETMTVQVPKKVAGKAVAAEAFAQDEGVNPALNTQTLAMYPTIFKEGGTVTPGNSCPMNDAAAALVMMSRDKCEALGLIPLATLKGYAVAGLEPERMGLGPALAIPKALKKAGVDKDAVDLFEINEAFAAQVIACDRLYGLPKEKLNVNGGAIALGHPIGATGVRLTLTLLYELKRRDARCGVVGLCVGGGMGAALVFERA